MENTYRISSVRCCECNVFLKDGPANRHDEHGKTIELGKPYIHEEEYFCEECYMTTILLEA